MAGSLKFQPQKRKSEALEVRGERNTQLRLTFAFRSAQYRLAAGEQVAAGTGTPPPAELLHLGGKTGRAFPSPGSGGATGESRWP